MFNLVFPASDRNCKPCHTLSLQLLLASAAILTRSEGQLGGLPDNVTYWDAVYTEAAGVKNFGRAWQGLDWASLNAVLEFGIRPEDKTLVLGAGDSGLPQEIFDGGCRNVTAVDFSTVLVSAMGERSHGVIWSVEEASHLSFPDSNFDVVLDLGLLDTVGIGGNDRMLKVVAEAHRVLSPGGVYVSSSTEPPLFRLPLFAHSFGGNATKVLFVPRPRELDHRIRRVDAAMDLGKVSVYVSRKPDVSIGAQESGTPESGFGAEQELPSVSDVPASDSQNIIAGDGHIEQANVTDMVQESIALAGDTSELARTSKESSAAEDTARAPEVSA